MVSELADRHTSEIIYILTRFAAQLIQLFRDPGDFLAIAILIGGWRGWSCIWDGCKGVRF
jgi:hypothetical protein